MDGDGGPVRPPRGGKIMVKQPSHSKAHSSLLISVIRPLAESQNYAERDAQKAKLEMNFKRIDQQLDDLVSTHHEELGSTMQAFSKISTKVTASRDRILAIKEKLGSCKTLLHCKREELKKLWLESVEHKHVLHLLEEIERIMEVPDQVETFAKNKRYLHATQLLVSSVDLLEGTLEGVDALKDVKAILISKKEQMHELLVDELQRHLYIFSTAEILRRFKIYGIEKRRSDSNNLSPAPSKMSASMLDLPLNCSPSRRSSRDHRVNIVYTLPSESPITEDLNLGDPEENTSKFIAILAESLTLLNKIPEAVEKIKERSQKELLSVIRRTAQHVLDHSQSVMMSQANGNHIHGENNSGKDCSSIMGQPQLLLDLVDLVFDELRCVVAAHKCLLGNLKRKIAINPSPDVTLYEMADIWSKVQVVLEILIGEYLDIHNTASARQPAPTVFAEVASPADIAAYFARKRPFKQKKFALFRFDASSHAISMNAYYQEQKEAMKEKSEFSDDLDLGQQLFVCQPESNNITVLFKPVMKFITEIEIALGLQTDQHCTLHSFLTDCVKVFLGEVVTEVDNIIDNVTKSLDTWKTVNDPDILKSLGSSKPLLQSTVMLDKSIQELQERMLALPMYSDQFLGIICSIVNNYRETCNYAYKSIVKPDKGLIQPDPKDKGIISYNWINDGDVNRLLRCLASWQCLEKRNNNSRRSDNNSGVGGGGKGISKENSFEESPADIQLRNQAETKMLVSTMAMKGLTIPLHEILPDVDHLKMLALINESMEWLACRLVIFTGALPKTPTASPTRTLMPYSNSDPDLQMQTESHSQVLNKLSREFRTLSETALLLLHLEVRVHCFYYLQPITTQVSFAINVDRQEPDQEILRLNKDMSDIDEATSSCLQSFKHQYIFEGLGSLVAYILMNSVTNMKLINENGVKKMCRNIFAVQQMLTGITMNREVDLDYARQYFELFYHTPEEILSFIVERGPQFQEQEYINALQLLHNSQDDFDSSDFNSLKEKLQNILNKVPVAV